MIARMRRATIWIVIVVGLLPLFGQEHTLPPIYPYPIIQNYSPEAYDALAQNWDILQTENGLIYIANSSCVLEFDGMEWRRILIPETQYVRALAKRKAGGIYVACHGEIGYLAPDSLSQLKYNSLLTYVPEDKRDFNVVIHIRETSKGIFWGTDKYIYHWNEEAKEMKVWAAGQNSTLCYAVNDEIYVRIFEKGLCKLGSDSLELVPGGEFFSARRIHMMIPWGGKRATPKMLCLLGFH